MLSIAIYIYHNASLEKVCAFIHANGGNIYFRQIITDRCNQLNISRKRFSKEAFGVLSSGSIHFLQWFIYLPPPLRVFHVSHILAHHY